MSPIQSVKRPPRWSHLVGAIVRTAGTERAVRVSLNGRTVNAMVSTLYRQVARRGLRLRYQTRGEAAGCILLWAERRAKAS